MRFFADVVLEYFNSGAGSIPTAYGGTFPGSFPVAVTPNVVLGDDPGSTVDFLSLPTNSFVTVGFTDERIVDGPGNDIFIREVGGNGELANIFVSVDSVNFTFLGIAQDDVTTSFDLSSIGFNQPVQAIKVVGLNSLGGSPGFDVVNVQVLQVLTIAGDRILTGGDNGEIITGGSGNDTLVGNGGNDKLTGLSGNDIISGGSGNDRIDGGLGNDRMGGDLGNNRITLGRGRDICEITKGFGVNTILDFKDRQDKLDLPGSTKFRSLTITQQGRNASINSGSDQLAVLIGTRADLITAVDFI